MEALNRRRDWRRWVYLGLTILLVVEVVQLGGRLQRRIAFPWDLLTVFESPHMAALAKLRAGEPLYGPAADANSEPYPPATVWLTYAVLKPLGLELDIRAARGVAVATTVVTALVAAWITRRTLLAAGIATVIANRTLPLVAAAAFLLLHKCLTSDQPHPDNLHILHAALLSYFCAQGAARGRTRDWIVAAVWASLGILTKQTAALAPAAVVVMLLAGRSFNRRTWLLIALTLFGGGLVTGALLADPLRDFHLRGAMGAHAVDLTRLNDIFFRAIPIRLFPRLVLIVVAALCFLRALREPALRPFLTAWSAVGFFEVAPAAAGFLKIGGNYNNLGVIDFWLFLVAAPVLILEIAPAPAKVAIRAALVCGWFVVALWPTKLVPNELCYRLGDEVERRVRNDVAAGRRVWLNVGLMFQFRAGEVTPPRDLAIAVWTLDAAAEKKPAGPAAVGLREGIERRLDAGEYDRVYDFFPWALKTRDRLPARYEQIEIIRGAGYGTHDEYHGIQPLVNRCTVYERRD